MSFSQARFSCLTKEARDLSQRQHQVQHEHTKTIPAVEDLTTRMIIHDHKAERAGPHFDMRIAMGGKAYSWATRYGFPEEPGRPRKWFEQPPHVMPYMDFQGKNTGYGAGHTSIKWDNPVKVTSQGQNRIELEVNHEPHQGRYVMLRDNGTDWLVIKKKDEKTAEDKGETLSVTLKLRTNRTLMKGIQQRLRKVFTGLAQFEKDFHVTLLYATGMTPADIKTVVPLIKKELVKSYSLRIGPVRDMVNHKGEAVIYLGVTHTGLEALATKLRKIVTPHGAKFTHDKWKGHVTLCYRSEPMTRADRSKLRHIDATFDARTSPADIEISQKKGEEWEKLAEPWGSLSKYAEDQKWSKVLIETPHATLTKRDVVNYYQHPKVQSGLMKDLLEHNGLTMIRQTIAPGETFLRRKTDSGAPIRITSRAGDLSDHADLHHYANRRVTEFHPVIEGDRTRRVWVDLDPKPGFPWERTRDLAGEIHRRLREMPGVTGTEIRFSGGKGFYIIGQLDRPRDVDEARKATQEAIRSLTGQKGVTLGIAGPGEIRLDTSTLKRLGSIRGAYSMNADTGLVSMPVPHSRLATFEPKDATVQKVLGR